MTITYSGNCSNALRANNFIGSSEKTKDEALQLVIQTVTGQYFSISAARHDAVGAIKAQIQNQTNLHPNQQKLIYAGRSLHDTTSFADNGIEKNSTLYLVVPLRGGSMGIALLRFVDCSETRLDPTRPWVKGTDPEWEKLLPGLNLKGTCSSKGNPCSGQTVWVPLKFSNEQAFNMSKECAKAHCVGCKALLTNIVNVHLLKCEVKIDGIDKYHNHYLANHKSDQPNKCLTFEEQGEQKITEWKYLEMTVTPLTESKKSCGWGAWLYSLFH